MSTFYFKRFSITNERSSMKVNSDAVLLGAAATLSDSTRTVLDIGTGTGILALMAAQRLENNSHLDITAIDIDSPSIDEAKGNFSSSPWGEHIHAELISLKDFEKENTNALYDLIISNPPYYDNYLTAQGESRNAARHSYVENGESMSLSWCDILDFAKEHLTETGTVSMILPHDFIEHVKRHAKKLGLHHFRTLTIQTTESKKPKRMVIEFKKEFTSSPLNDTIILLEKGKRTREHISLTEDFYI